jgi:hypothetical protein
VAAIDKITSFIEQFARPIAEVVSGLVEGIRPSRSVIHHTGHHLASISERPRLVFTPGVHLNLKRGIQYIKKFVHVGKRRHI